MEKKITVKHKGNDAKKPNDNQNSNEVIERLVDWNKIVAIVKKNWMVLSRDSARVIPLFMFPIIMIVIYGSATGTLPKNVAAGIVDYDNTATSQMIKNELYSYNLLAFKYQLGSQDEGKKLMDQGKLKLLFIIPDGFEEDIANGKTAYVSIMVDESDPTIAQITKSSTANFMEGISKGLAAERTAKVYSIAASAKQDSSAISRMLLEESRKDYEVIKSSGETETRLRNALAKASATNLGLGTSILELQNTLGVIIDQNNVLENLQNRTVDARSALLFLALGDQQQNTLTQMGIYSGLRGSISSIAADTAKIGADARKSYALSLAELAVMKAASEQTDRLTLKLDNLLDENRKLMNQPIGINLVEPYGSGRRGIDFLLPNILALIIFQGATMGLGRAIAGERKDGSLTRVFLTPTSNTTIIVGTQLFYLLLETVRSSVIIFASMALFGVTLKGSMQDIIGIISIYAAGATGIGMVMSVIAKNQEQYMALSMLISLPVMFLSGVFLPIETMPGEFKAIAAALPVTYAADALRAIIVKGFGFWQIIPDIMFLAGFAFATIAVSLLMFKRELI